MSRLQVLINQLVEMLTEYYSKQTQSPLDPRKYTSMADAELRQALKKINQDAVAGTRSIRHSLLEYVRFTITVVRPLVNNGRLLSADEEVKIVNTLSSLLNDCLRLLGQRETLRVVYEHCGLLKMPTDPASLSGDELNRILLNPSSYVLFDSKIYYIELNKYPDPAAPQSSSSPASIASNSTHIFTCTTAEQLNKLERLFTDHYSDATQANLQEIKALTGHTYKVKQVDMPGMYGTVSNTSSTAAFRSAVLNPFGIKESSSEAEITAWIKKQVVKHQMPFKLDELLLLTQLQETQIYSLQKTLEAEKAKSAELSLDLAAAKMKIGDTEVLETKLHAKSGEIELLRTQVSDLIANQRRIPGSALLRVKLASDQHLERTKSLYPGSLFSAPAVKPITIEPDSVIQQNSLDRRKA